MAIRIVNSSGGSIRHMKVSVKGSLDADAYPQGGAVLYQFEGSHVGYVFDGDPTTPYLPAMLTFGFDLALLELPLIAGVTQFCDSWFEKEESLPEGLTFSNSKECFSLSDLSIRRHSYSWPAGLGVGILEAGRIVKAGLNNTNYTQINGLQSEIAGLQWWIEPKVFEHEYHADSEGRITGVDFKVTSAPGFLIPGVPGLELAPSFESDHNWAEGRHQMRELVVVKTELGTPTGWHTHHRIHRALQDLVSLSFWHPCNLAVHRVLRTDDPERSIDGTSHGTIWRPAWGSGFGRRRKGQPIRDFGSNRQRPLFGFADIGQAGLAKWFKEYDDLGQAMWVLSASLFREGGTVEVRLLQVGTALEALGYELAIRGGRLSRGKRDMSFTFAKALELVVVSTDCDLDKVLKGESPSSWAQLFNQSYKGVKHADNPLPNAVEAHHRAEEGALLARLWLALHLGVNKDTLAQRIGNVHT